MIQIERLLRTILILSAVLIGQVSFGQNGKITLTGKVTDEKNGQPLPFANVFLNNSSIGTNADGNGNYKLTDLPIGTLEIAVTFLGYETIKQTLRFETPGTKTVVFKMREGMQLGAVTIHAKKNKKREKDIKTITKELLGNSPFSKQCRLVNTEVLRIYAEDGHVEAQTTSPLIIENSALGYRIHQDLDDFDYYNGKVFYGGATRFELLKPKDEAQKKLWRSNQEKAYKGSLKHLLASMVADSLIENGFRVYQEIPDSLRFSSMRPSNGYNSISNHINNRITLVRGEKLIRPGQLENERLVVSSTKLEIFNMKKKGRSLYQDMPYAYTQITLPRGYMIITPEGWVVMPMAFEIAGDLGNDRFSTLLPADWVRDL